MYLLGICYIDYNSTRTEHNLGTGLGSSATICKTKRPLTLMHAARESISRERRARRDAFFVVRDIKRTCQVGV